MEKIRVLIVDDSALVRVALRTILESDPIFEVVGEAKDGREGVEKTFRLKPNVVTMDLKMPVMGGVEAIKEIMEKIPTPVIIISSLDVNVIVRALGAGAMDFVPVTGEVETIADEVIEKVRIASRIRPLKHIHLKPLVHKVAERGLPESSKKIVVIGISTGGPQALQVLFSQLPENFPAGIIVVQHMANGFVEGLTEWLQGSSPLQIRVAKAGDIIQRGTVLFAPDAVNLGISEQGTIFLKEDHSHKMLYVPSINFLMESAAMNYGQNLVGVLMTGMGSDGADGLGRIQRQGGVTIAQDEKSSIIFGMNKVAIEKGYADHILPLEKIADELIRLVE